MLQDDHFYGTTTSSQHPDGVIFGVSLKDGKATLLHAFSGPDGAAPSSHLLYQGGYLYGTTDEGGANDVGTIFRIDLKTGALTTLYTCSQTDYEFPFAGLNAFGHTLYGTSLGGGVYGLGALFVLSP